jgi:putative transposase
MHRVVHLQLRPAAAQAAALQHTLETLNAARNLISSVAWHTETFAPPALAVLCTADVRSQFGLSAAMTVRCVASVAATYQHGRSAKHLFRPHTSVPYDRRTLRIDVDAQTVTIWTLIGWQTMPFALDMRLPESWRRPTLAAVSGTWYLLVIVPVEDIFA